MLVKIIDFFRDRLKLVIRLSLAVLALLVVLDLFVERTKVYIWLEHFPGFWSLFGFVGCVLIIILSKWFGYLGIVTREDYYDD